jgi:hypothetical protein
MYCRGLQPILDFAKLCRSRQKLVKGGRDPDPAHCAPTLALFPDEGVTMSAPAKIGGGGSAIVQAIWLSVGSELGRVVSRLTAPASEPNEV